VSIPDFIVKLYLRSCQTWQIVCTCNTTPRLTHYHSAAGHHSICLHPCWTR